MDRCRINTSGALAIIMLTELDKNGLRWEVIRAAVYLYGGGDHALAVLARKASPEGEFCRQCMVELCAPYID